MKKSFSGGPGCLWPDVWRQGRPRRPGPGGIQVPSGKDRVRPGRRPGDTLRQALPLAALKGKVVMITLWSIDCRFCYEELLDLQAFRDKHRRKGLEMLGLSVDDGADEIRDWPAALSCPQLPRRLAPAPGSDDGLALPKGTPTTYVVDRQGTSSQALRAIARRALRLHRKPAWSQAMTLRHLPPGSRGGGGRRGAGNYPDRGPDRPPSLSSRYHDYWIDGVEVAGRLGPKTAPAGQRYVVVRFTARNFDKEPRARLRQGTGRQPGGKGAGIRPG